MFLVTLPLCLGIALASGAPLYSGLVSGIVAGLLVTFLSGSQLVISGPAAGLTVIVASAILQLQSFEAFLVSVVLAGCLQLILGGLRLGRLSAYFPESVIRGMLVAIGIVIILKQIPHALGDDRDAEGEFEFFQNDHQNTVTEIIQAFSSIKEGALLISALVILLLIGWNKLADKGVRFFTFFPSVLAAVLFGVGLNELFKLYSPDLYLGNSPGHMVNIPIGRAAFVHYLHVPDFSFLANGQVWIIAGTLALVASLESLITLEAADALDPERRISSPNRELVAQGIGNIVCGVLGGLPISAVIVRTSTNIYAGSRTRMSSFINGVLLVLAVLAVPALINRIPLAALAAILIVVGYRLAHPTKISQQAKEGLDQFLPFLITILLIVFTDLLIGIIGGTLVGLFFVLYTNSRSELTVVRDGNLVLVKFNKDVSFLSKARIKKALRGLHKGDSIIFDGTKATFVDYDVFHIMKEFRDISPDRGIEVSFKNVGRRKLEDRSEVEAL